MKFIFTFFLFFPFAVFAKDAHDKSPENYGIGVLCPKPDTQIAFYTENNQQDAAGTLSFDAGAGFIVTSDSIKDLKGANAQVMDKNCDNGVQGIRIDSKRDGWLQAGKVWVPPNQEWEYADWQDLLRKAAIWKPLSSVVLYQGTADAPFKDKPYAVQAAKKMEIYPLKFTDDFALVLLDENDAFAKSCAGTPMPPKGSMGWIKLNGEDGKPFAVPVYSKGCQ